MIAVAGRARIEEQKQTALTNIQTNKNAALKQLNIQVLLLVGTGLGGGRVTSNQFFF